MRQNTRIPVLAADGTPLMPTKYCRAEVWVNRGDAKWESNDLNIKAVRLLRKPSGYFTQKIVLGIDPGKLFTGVGLASASSTLLLLHLVLPFPKVKARKAAQKILRRARRGRRINRKLPFNLRNHRQRRFDNRRGKKLAPSIRANLEMEQRIISEIFKLFPVSAVVWEMVRADVDLTSGRKKARSGKGFSPVMIKQKTAVNWLNTFTSVVEKHGWETAQIRQHLSLTKCHDKKSQSPNAHAVDGLALAASQFVKYESFQARTEHGHDWVGSIKLTSAPFRVITRPGIYRRQLHFENFSKGGIRKRKGGTITPWEFRSGDFVQAQKAGKVYRGWVGGFSSANKVISIYTHEWKRIGQFSTSKVMLIKRKTGLCVA